MKMPLYTFVMDYLGGTYVSQFEAENIDSAIHKWAHSLDTDNIDGLGPVGKKRLINEVALTDETPTHLNGLKNVWCICGRTSKGMALINIVLTEN